MREDEGRRVRVLIVGGDENIAELLHSSASAAADLEVSKVAAGEEVEHAIKVFVPEVVFVDSNCGAVSVADLVKKALACDRSLLVAAVLASSDEHTLRELLALGVADVLLKPLSSAALSGVLTRFRWNIARREVRRFTPGLLAEGEVRFELVSTHRAIPPAVNSVRDVVEPFLPTPELTRLTDAVYEALVNGLEHGNYGISSSQRREAQSSGEWESFLHNRSLETIRRGVALTLVVKITPFVVECSVIDRGPGFDWRRALEQAAVAAQSSEELRQRGLFLIMSAFDELEFNEMGNTVTGRKKLPRTRLF